MTIRADILQHLVTQYGLRDCYANHIRSMLRFIDLDNFTPTAFDTWVEQLRKNRAEYFTR